MTVSTFFIYALFYRSASNEVADHSVALMKERANITSLLLESVSTYAINWSKNARINTYALRKYKDPYEDNQIYMIGLREALKYNPFVESAYIVNGYNATVLSSNYGLYSLDDFWDEEVIDKIRSMDQSFQVAFLPRTVDKILIGKPYKKNLLSIIVAYESNRSISSFVLNVDLNKVHSFAGKDEDRDAANEINLYDENGTSAASNKTSPVLLRLPELPLGEARERGHIQLDSNRDGYLLAYADIPFQGLKGWTMAELIPEKKIFRSLYVLRNWTIVFYVAFFVSLLVMIWRLSRRIYSPIEELLADVKRNHSALRDDPNVHPANELSYLSHILDRQKTQLRQLSNYWRENRLASKESIVKELLLYPTEFPAEKWQDKLKEHEIPLSLRSLRVVVFRVDRFVAFCETYSAHNQRLIKYAVQNIVKEDLAGYAIETAGMDDHIAAVLNVDDEQGLSSLFPQLERIQGHLTQYLALSSTIVVSVFVCEYGKLHDAYAQALECSNERFKSGTGQILFAGDQTSGAESEYLYPEVLERSVLKELKLGHQEECIYHLRQFVGYMSNYSYSEIRLALTHFMINLGKTLRQIRQDDNDPLSWNLTSIEKQIDYLETADNVREWLISVIRRAFESTQSSKSARHAKLIEDIRRVVETNIGNVNLSSKFVADSLGMSVPYLRPMFKEIMNQSLSDYITGMRLEEVKRQLAGSDKTIEEIAKNAGFPALNSFYAIFKKNCGLTPAQYRKEKQRSNLT